ncbi:hypothetical protein GF377_03350 [candidate division GN15 bacterium]|nr:hypothetical protein [candidate division GN15 bacterium]
MPLNTSLNVRLAIIFAITVAARLAFYFATGYTADDAFITFRYADNIAHGLGYVYNAGDPVQGTTTPLFTFLMALFALLNVPLIGASLFVSTIAAGLTAVLLYKFALSLRFTRWALLPVLAYALWPRSLPADTSGMETAVFTLLVTAAFYFRHRKLDIYAVGMATLATVTRPEGALVLALVLIANIYEHRERLLAYLSIPLMILVPWLMFTFFYFGSLVPNSIPAKLALYSQWGTMSTWDTLVYLMAWHNSVGLVTTLAVVMGAYWLWGKQYFGRLELIWLVGMIVFYTVSSSRVFFWYIAPIYPLYLMFACAAVVFAFDRLNLALERELLWRNAIMVLAAAGLLVGCYKPLLYYREFQQAQVDMHKAVGLYLSRHAGLDDLVAAEDIGYMGYYSERRILDRDGLVSPEAIPYTRSGNYIGLILDYDPAWVVASPNTPLSGFVDNPRFLSEYRLAKTFAHDELEYRVYEREPAVETYDSGSSEKSDELTTE